MQTTLQPCAPTLAAPAPDTEDPADQADAGEAPVNEAQQAEDARLDALCEQLAHWCATRRFYGAPRRPASLLGSLGKRTRPLGQAPDAECSAQLSALYLALLAQPADALDRRVFELHYLHRVRNIKAASAAIGVSRQHWYKLLRDFRRRIVSAAGHIQAHREAARVALPSLVGQP